MSKATTLTFIAITMFLLVISLDVFKFELLSSTLELSLVPIITIFYFFLVKNKSKHLSSFFVLYSMADFINILDFNAESNWSYFACSMIYIVAFFFLILYIIKTLNFKLVFKRFKLDFCVLLVLNAYMSYVLFNIMKSIDFESNYDGLVQATELLYSLTLILALSLSLLNYVQNTQKKHLLLFVACTLIAFSELILIGYYYIIDDIRLSYISTALSVCGVFVLFYHTFSASKTEQIT